MHPEIFIEICGHWTMRLSLTSSGGRSKWPVNVIPVTFPIFGGKKLYQFLVMGENFL